MVRLVKEQAEVLQLFEKELLSVIAVL